MIIVLKCVGKHHVKIQMFMFMLTVHDLIKSQLTRQKIRQLTRQNIRQFITNPILSAFITTRQEDAVSTG